MAAAVAASVALVTIPYAPNWWLKVILPRLQPHVTLWYVDRRGEPEVHPDADVPVADIFGNYAGSLLGFWGWLAASPHSPWRRDSKTERTAIPA